MARPDPTAEKLFPHEEQRAREAYAAALRHAGGEGHRLALRVLTWPMPRLPFFAEAAIRALMSEMR